MLNFVPQTSVLDGRELNWTVTVEANAEKLIVFTELVAVFSFIVTPECRPGNGHLSRYGSRCGTWSGLVYRGFERFGERGLWNMNVSPWERREWNSEGGLLYSRLRETYDGSLWKRSLSFIRPHKGNLRHLVKWGGGLGQYVQWTGTCTWCVVVSWIT